MSLQLLVGKFVAVLIQKGIQVKSISATQIEQLGHMRFRLGHASFNESVSFTDNNMLVLLFLQVAEIVEGRQYIYWEQ